MANQPLFLITAGTIDKEEFQHACQDLANGWGCNLREQDCSSEPNSSLKALGSDYLMVKLDGDPAVSKTNGGSWLEALGSWKKLAILFTSPLHDSNEIGGVAAAYVALCEKLEVPLVGIIQVGGEWNESLRKKEGLPWCGKISLKSKSGKVHNDEISNHYEELKEIIIILKKSINKV